MSSKFIPLELCNLVNHKLIYDSLPTGDNDFGLDKICILRKNFNCGSLAIINGIDFEFALENYDNIFCENQEIEINQIAKTINILGFSYWGDNYEFFKVVYDDGTTELLKVMLPDWSHAVENAPVNMQFELFDCKVKTGEIFLSSGKTVHMTHLHHFSGTLKNDKVISKIVFPDNMFMHILAITLED